MEACLEIKEHFGGVLSKTPDLSLELLYVAEKGLRLLSCWDGLYQKGKNQTKPPSSIPEDLFPR